MNHSPPSPMVDMKITFAVPRVSSRTAAHENNKQPTWRSLVPWSYRLLFGKVLTTYFALRQERTLWAKENTMNIHHLRSKTIFRSMPFKALKIFWHCVTFRSLVKRTQHPFAVTRGCDCRMMPANSGQPQCRLTFGGAERSAEASQSPKEEKAPKFSADVWAIVIACFSMTPAKSGWIVTLIKAAW